jgi:anti-sigma-K factor RskA
VVPAGKINTPQFTFAVISRESDHVSVSCGVLGDARDMMLVREVDMEDCVVRPSLYAVVFHYTGERSL